MMHLPYHRYHHLPARKKIASTPGIGSTQAFGGAQGVGATAASIVAATDSTENIPNLILVYNIIIGYEYMKSWKVCFLPMNIKTILKTMPKYTYFGQRIFTEYL